MRKTKIIAPRQHENKYADLAPPSSRRPGKRQEKRSYATLEEAQAMSESMELRFGMAFNAYYCPSCDQYHVGRSS